MWFGANRGRACGALFLGRNMFPTATHGRSSTCPLLYLASHAARKWGQFGPKANCTPQAGPIRLDVRIRSDAMQSTRGTDDP